MKLTQYKLVVATFLTLAILFTGNGCKRDPKGPETSSSGDHATCDPSKMEKLKFRLAWVPDMAEAGVFVAKENGYFKKECLDVTIEPGGFGLDSIKLVAGGSSDFGVGGAGNLLMARANGVPVVAIAAEFQNTPVGFITRADSGIDSFEKFKGKKIGVQTGSDTDVLYRALLVKSGMTSADVQEIPIQYDMTPFLTKAIDVLPGYVTNQPVTLESKGEKVAVITAESQGLDYYGNIFFTTEDRITKNPEQVKRFVKALKKGWQHALESKQDAINALKEQTKDFDSKDLDVIYDRVMPFIKTDSQPLLGMNIEKWKTTKEVLKNAALLKEDVELSTAFTTNFLTE